MQAVSRFMLHLTDETAIPGYGPGTHIIARGQEIPADMVPLIHNQDVVDEALPHLVDEAERRGLEPPTVPEYGEYQDLKTVEDVLQWVFGAVDTDERLKRAHYAKDRENEGKQRSSLLNQIDDFVAGVGG